MYLITVDVNPITWFMWYLIGFYIVKLVFFPFAINILQLCQTILFLNFHRLIFFFTHQQILL